ncbi:thioesterase family protein [Maricaulis sp. D1M11]|uniref:thioesterase family protein n=1 Tax=Maricaulis sp. D1M11 TaxID=3076117 RepID=UPI0039B42A66
MIELWRGNANAWECDELGHMNVRHYIAKADEALANLGDAAGLGAVRRENATATLIPDAIHIRFLAEARPGVPLTILGGFTEIRESDADVLMIMMHAAAETPAATYRMRIRHADPRHTHSFPWPRRFHRHADLLGVETPDFARPRGIREDRPLAQPSLEKADALKLETIGRGRFQPGDMDVFGRMSIDGLIGRISDSVIHFRGAFPEEWDAHRDGGELATASALLETRILPRRWPRAGDGYVIRSGLVEASDKIRRLVHWVLDPNTGKPWWTCEGVAAPMDLKARKLAPATPEILAGLQARCLSGLGV